MTDNIEETNVQPPYSRREILLQEINTQLTGGTAGNIEELVPPPYTREEILLIETLTAIESGGGGKTLYEHNILLTEHSESVRTGVTTVIINDDPTEFTFDALIDYLNAGSGKPFSNGKVKSASGTYSDIIEEDIHQVYGIKRNNSYISLVGVNGADEQAVRTMTKSSTTVKDAVVEI